MDVIGHHCPSAKLVEAALAGAADDGIRDDRCDFSLLEPAGSPRIEVQRTVGGGKGVGGGWVSSG